MSDDHFADVGKMVRRISDEILHRIVAPEEGDVVSVVTPENAREIADEAARAIAALISEERPRKRPPMASDHIDLARNIEELVIQIIAGMDEPEAAIAALIAEREAAARKESCAWADAIERWFIEWEMLPDWSAADPWEELHRMICWEQQVALDPAVSEDARKLIAEERARAFEEAAQSVDCGCTNGPAVIKVVRDYGGNCAARWQLCGLDMCSAIEAAAIRALAKKETADGE